MWDENGELTVFCSNCGTPYDDDALFCANCGEPKANTSTTVNPGYTLATRPSRLGAKLIDTAVWVGAGIVVAIVFYASTPLGFLLLLVAGVGIPIIQVALLARDGQTIGKKVVDIRIVSVETGQNAGFGSNVAMRAWVNFLLGIIPLYGLVDILFIFRDDQRCIHDLIAGTHVVE
jgi:uncharacterized RDD family membrane protein YckC